MLQFPKQRLCEVCYTKDSFDDARLSDRSGRVVTFTLDMPPQIVFQSVDKQKALIDARVDIEKFKDPEFVDDFIRRFLLRKDAENGLGGFGGGGGNAHLLPLFQGGGIFNLFA